MYAIRYRLDGLGIGSLGGRGFLLPSRPLLTATQPPRKMGNGSLSPRMQRSGHGIDHTPPSSADVDERVELYLYSMACCRVNFSFTIRLLSQDANEQEIN